MPHARRRCVVKRPFANPCGASSAKVEPLTTLSTVFHRARRRAHCFRCVYVARGRVQGVARSILCGADRPDRIEVSLLPSRTLPLVSIRHRDGNSARMVELHWIRLSAEHELARHTRSGVFVKGWGHGRWPRDRERRGHHADDRFLGVVGHALITLARLALRRHRLEKCSRNHR